jgi:hypothetical protein
MKKTMLLSLALGLAGASSLTAATVDVYLTGSTAFRQNCYTASIKLFSSAPTIYFGDSAHGGDANFNSSTASWVMSGAPVSTLTNLAGNTLVVHGLFTGSIQGVQTVEQSVLLVFPKADGLGTAGGATANYVTNTPTIAFSDASVASTPYPATGNYAEEAVAVLPFVICKSMGTGNVSNYVNNITWEQLEYGIPVGRIPLSAWTYKDGDDRTNNFIYLYQRTKDSGTRRAETAQEYFGFTDPVGVYIYDAATNGYYPSSSMVLSNNVTGLAPYGVIGPAGLNNANVSSDWGFGYVGGGNIATALNIKNPANQALGYLSFSDAKTVGPGAPAIYTNWANVISFNGLWPTTEGPAIHTHLINTTNDFSPVTTGYYPCWSQLVLVTLKNPAANPPGDQNIGANQLGDNKTPGTFLGVFNAQTLIYTNLPSPVVGSIENEIELSKPAGATAIRLSDMKSKRGQVGGTIAPF